MFEKQIKYKKIFYTYLFVFLNQTLYYKKGLSLMQKLSVLYTI
jgi:hypothetical protein